MRRALRSLSVLAATTALTCAAALSAPSALLPNAAAAPVTITVPGAALGSATQAVGSADALLTATGQPGPHRVAGHYFTSPSVPAAQAAIQPTALVGPSTPVSVGDSVCTIGVAGVDAQGNKVAITAGHCGTPGAPVRSLDAPDAGVIGTYVRTGFPDVGVIKLNPSVQITRSYGAVNLNSLGGAVPSALQNLCKTGISTGTSCGPMGVVTGPYIVAHICGSYGDSGAPIYAGSRLIGIVNGGIGSLPSCVTPLQGPLHAPTAGAHWDIIRADLDAAGGVGAGFRLP